MARRVFFSFHYDRDIWRASQVRNSWVTQDRETAGFWDAAKWEEVKRGGEAAIKAWIEKQLEGTSVLVSLIGAETVSRKYCLYEIERANALGKGLLGVYIHGLKNKDGKTDVQGPNPFSKVKTNVIVQTYDYVANNGYSNFASWVEAAAKAVGR